MGRAKRRPMITEPLPCEGVCGRMLRPKDTRIADYPNTTRMYSDRKCMKCYNELMGRGKVDTSLVPGLDSFLNERRRRLEVNRKAGR